MTAIAERALKPVGEGTLSVPLKVLIADDHPLILAGLRRGLEANENVEVIGEARSGPEVIHMIEHRRPELVLLDLRMPGVSDVECIQRITQTWPEVKVVALSACSDRASIDGALAAGASAYIVKSVQSPEIVSVLHQVASGGVFHAGTRANRMRLVESEEQRAPALTDRERAILEAIASGATTAAISKELWVSEHTIKFHLTNIYRKLGVANRAGAVRYAFENGLIDS
jgi:DNA-binding NarL/FixJ family response regulator